MDERTISLDDLLLILKQYEQECPACDLHEVDLLIRNPYMIKGSYILPIIEQYVKRYELRRRIFKS